MTLSQALGRSLGLCAAAMIGSALSAQLADHAHGPSANEPVMHGEYVENKGQWAAQILYRADFGVVALFAERDRLVFSKIDEAVLERVHDAQHEGPGAMEQVRVNGHAWYAWFEGANLNAEVTRDGRSSDYFNYFIGNDASKWASDVRHFEEVRYRELWPGVDLRLHDEAGGFKYDMIVANAEAASAIKMRYEGLDAMRINADGELELSTSVGEVHELAPVAWYADGAKEKVECRFTLNGSTVGFSVGSGTNADRPIVIDPTLIASTLSGTGNIGTTQNYGHTATYDQLGNIYTGAICFGQGYPTLAGAFDGTNNGGIDIAVSKLNPTGTTLLFGTYLGGSSGDYPHSLVVTPMGELTVYGSSPSPNYPTTPTAYDATFNGGTADIVISKLNPTGTALIGSTYMGTSGSDGRNTFTSNYGDSYRGEVICDAAGRIFVASCSDSPGFPTSGGALQPAHAGAQDGVAFSLSPDLSTLLWSTYFGTAQGDMCFGIKLNSMGEPYICGGTAGTTLPVTPGAAQAVNNGADEAFIAHLSQNASSVIACTYFGGSGDDVAFFLQVDIDDNAYIFGQSPAANLGIVPASTYGAATGGIFVAEFNQDLTAEVFRTQLGPGGGGWGAGMVPVAFLVDVCRNIYISGYSVGAGWPIAGTPLYNNGGFYLATFEPDMTNIIYGTYYTGAGHVDGGTSRFDANGKVYQAVCTSGGFPTTPGAYSNVQPAGWDIGVFKIDFNVSGVNAAGASTLNQGCAPIQIDFSNASTGDTWVWDFGDGSPTVEAFEPSHTYTDPGTYTVMLIAMDSLSCNLADTTYLPITIGQQQPIDADFTWTQTIDCTQMEITTTNLSTGDPLSWYWDMGDGTTYVDTNVVHQFPGPGSYLVQLIAEDPTGCSGADTVQITVDIGPPAQVAAAFTTAETPGCDELTVACTNQSTGIDMTYLWDMGDGTTYTSADVTHLFQGVGTYTITLIVNDTSSCNVADTVTADVTVLPSAPIDVAFVADQVFDCDELLLTTDNQSTGTNAAYLWQLSDGAQYTTEDISHVFSGPGTYTVTLTMTDTLGCSPSNQPNPYVSVPGPGTYSYTITVFDQYCQLQESFDMSVEVPPASMTIDLPSPAYICPNGTALLDAGPGYDSYQWSTGEVSQMITVTEPGLYDIAVSSGFCDAADQIQVIEVGVPEGMADVESCPEADVSLMPTFDPQSILWSTGSEEESISVSLPGEYTFTAIDQYGCSFLDTVVVTHLATTDGEAIIPNVFSPNGDGKNDVFEVRGLGVQEFSMEVYNRWGQKMYETNSPVRGWKGQVDNESDLPVPDGTYFYIVSYRDLCSDDPDVSKAGHVTLLR